jgi:hypothetical protein
MVMLGDRKKTVDQDEDDEIEDAFDSDEGNEEEDEFPF